MKKVALSLLAFALVGAGAFADGADAVKDIQKNAPTFTLDVNAQAQFGIDLDTKVHGIAQSATTNFSLWFLNGTSEKTGAGDTHGYIKVDTLKYGTDDTTTAPAVTLPSVVAKIVSGDLYVKLYDGKITPSVSYSRDVDNDNGGTGTAADDTFKNYAGKYGTDTEWNDTAIAAAASFTGAGFEVGYALPKLVSIAVDVASENDWTVGQQSGYAASAAVGLLAVDKLTLEGKFYTAKTAVDATAFGVTTAYDLGVVSPLVNLNYDVTNSKYTADFGAKLPIVDGLKAVAWGQYNSDKVFNAEATVDVAAAKLAGPLSADVGLRLKDLTKAVAANATTEIFAKATFKASDVLSIYGSVDTYNTAASTDSSLFAKAGVDFTGISLTTISANWDSSDLGAAKATGDSKLGKFVVTAKVAY
jgi:hypothetical protein